MNILNRVLAIGLSFGLTCIVFELIRRRKLKEKYALLWLITSVTILTLAIFDKLLIGFIGLLGIVLPINGVLFLGLFFLIVINLHITVVVSGLSEQNKKIVQKIALLEAKLVR